MTDFLIGKTSPDRPLFLLRDFAPTSMRVCVCVCARARCDCCDIRRLVSQIENQLLELIRSYEVQTCIVLSHRSHHSLSRLL